MVCRAVKCSTLTDLTAVVVDMMTMKMVEKKPKPTFSRKADAEHQDEHRQEDRFGNAEGKEQQRLYHFGEIAVLGDQEPDQRADRHRDDERGQRLRSPVTRISLRTLARCSRSPSMTRVSDAEGKGGDLTAPAATGFPTSRRRRALWRRAPLDLERAGHRQTLTAWLATGSNWVEMIFRSRRQIIHAAHLRHVELNA